MSPKRLTLSRRKGSKLPPGARKVDRSTIFGNPFRVGIHGDAEACVARFRDLLTGLVRMYPVPCPAYLDQIAARDRILAGLSELRGVDLACWCKPGEPCHADVLLELANAPDERARIFADLAPSISQSEQRAAIKLAKSVRREMILRLEGLYRLRKSYADTDLPEVRRELQRIRRRLRKAENEIEPFGYRVTAPRGGWNPQWRADRSALRKWIDKIEAE